MSRNFDNRLNLLVNPSLTLGATMVMVHTGGLAAVWSTALPLALRITLAAVVLASLYHALAFHALRRSPRAIRMLELEDSDECRVQLQNEDRLGPCRLRAYYVHRWLVILQLRCANRRFPVNLIIPADAVAPPVFRQFCARLHARGPAA